MKDWQSIYNLSPGYLFSFSDDGVITRMNAALLSALGYSWNEVVNVRKIEELLTPGTRIFFQTHLFPLIKMQGSAKELFLTFTSKTKERLPILLNVLLEGDSKVFEVHCAGMEISNRSQFEKELFEAKNIAEKALLENKDLIRLKEELEVNQQILEKQLQQISRFSYENLQINKVLAHDMQEPLRKINIFISLIDLQIGTGHPAHANFLKIKKFATRIRNLINSMQRFNSLDHQQLEYNDINLDMLLRIAANNANCAEAKIFFTGNKDISFKADVELLTNMFEELFNNSLKFKQTGRPLEIEINTDSVLHNIYKHTENRYNYKEFVRIAFKDNGTGFENQYSKQIFELFRKLHPGEGLGIGLAYCKKIVDLHNGAITVDSALDKGTNFNILLPLEPVLVEDTHLNS